MLEHAVADILLDLEVLPVAPVRDDAVRVTITIEIAERDPSHAPRRGNHSDIGESPRTQALVEEQIALAVHGDNICVAVDICVHQMRPVAFGVEAHGDRSAQPPTPKAGEQVDVRLEPGHDILATISIDIAQFNVVDLHRQIVGYLRVEVALAGVEEDRGKGGGVAIRGGQ